jgi:prepilin-type processing-associated H-X9-DG protein
LLGDCASTILPNSGSGSGQTYTIDYFLEPDPEGNNYESGFGANPALQGRHLGQANVAWFDSHAKSMHVVPIPASVLAQTGDPESVTIAAQYASADIGAVFPSGQTWTFGSNAQNFYYLPQKPTQ